MDILDKIVAHKQKELAQKKNLFPLSKLTQSPSYRTACVSMVKHLKNPAKAGIIAEFKRRSPSKDAINLDAKIEQVTTSYIQAGSSGLSVLTDEHFFGGKNEDLRITRKFNSCPILRKDFIIDPYQVHEAKSIGADTILLIAEVLSKKEVEELSSIAKSLNLEVLMEVHSTNQLEKLNQNIDIVGVNNRNLKDFSVSLDASLNMINDIPSSFTKISESGISNAESIIKLKSAGYDGFLIGEHFMRSSNPGLKCRQLINEINSLESNEAPYKTIQ